MIGSVTHFEINGPEPTALANFYRESLGGSVVRPKTAVPRTAWVTIVADPAGPAMRQP